MNNTDKREEFSFWKYPWQKWFVLVAALSQILCLWGNILDYKEYRKMFGYGILPITSRVWGAFIQIFTAYLLDWCVLHQF